MCAVVFSNLHIKNNNMTNHQDGERFLLVKNGETYPKLIILQWSKAGGATAFQAFSDTVIGKATGYGYDKTSQAVSMAIEKLTGDDIGGYGVGIETVQRRAAEYGHTLYLWHDILALVIKAHTKSDTYTIARKALENSETKTRTNVYGQNSQAVSNEAIAMAMFIDSRMHKSSIISSLEK